MPGRGVGAGPDEWWESGVPVSGWEVVRPMSPIASPPPGGRIPPGPFLHLPRCSERSRQRPKVWALQEVQAPGGVELGKEEALVPGLQPLLLGLQLAGVYPPQTPALPALPARADLCVFT